MPRTSFCNLCRFSAGVSVQRASGPAPPAGLGALDVLKPRGLWRAGSREERESFVGGRVIHVSRVGWPEGGAGVVSSSRSFVGRVVVEGMEDVVGRVGP